MIFLILLGIWLFSGFAATLISIFYMLFRDEAITNFTRHDWATMGVMIITGIISLFIVVDVIKFDMESRKGDKH